MRREQDMDMAAAPAELTRREREAIEAQRKKDNYMKLHAEGKTDEAKVWCCIHLQELQETYFRVDAGEEGGYSYRLQELHEISFVNGRGFKWFYPMVSCYILVLTVLYSYVNEPRIVLHVIEYNMK